MERCFSVGVDAIPCVWDCDRLYESCSPGQYPDGDHVVGGVLGTVLGIMLFKVFKLS